MTKALADFEWRGGELVRRTPADRARGLAWLFGHLEAVMDASDVGAADAPDAIAQETWLAMRELGRVYQLFARGLRAAADGNVAAREPMTASRMSELLLAISAAEARLFGALAAERSRWLDEFLQA